MHSFLYGLHYKPMRKEGAWVTGLLQDARPDRVSTGIHSQSRKASCLCEMVIRAKPELLSLRAWGKTHARKTEPNTVRRNVSRPRVPHGILKRRHQCA